MIATPGPGSAPRADDFVPLVRTLLRAFRAAEHAAVQALREAGLTVAGPAAWDLLRALPENGVRASALARDLGVTKQAVGQTLRELEKAGLVERVRDPDDRRALIVRATEAGQRAAEEGEGALRAQEALIAEALGRTRLKALRATLDELANTLDD